MLGESVCGEGRGADGIRGMADALMKANPDRILVTDEIGYGIVPVDPFERQYRETAGRICCQAAGYASQVWRVCCGIGQRINCIRAIRSIRNARSARYLDPWGRCGLGVLYGWYVL